MDGCIVICQITSGKSTINDVIFLAKWTKDPAKRGLLNDSLLLLVNTQTQVFWFFREDSRRNIGPWWISIDCCCEEGFVFFSQATPEGSLNRWDLLKEPLRLRLSSVLSTIFIFSLSGQTVFLPQNRRILVVQCRDNILQFAILNTLFHHQLWDMTKNRWCIILQWNVLSFRCSAIQCILKMAWKMD